MDGEHVRGGKVAMPRIRGILGHSGSGWLRRNLVENEAIGETVDWIFMIE